MKTTTTISWVITLTSCVNSSRVLCLTSSEICIALAPFSFQTYCPNLPSPNHQHHRPQALLFGAALETLERFREQMTREDFGQGQREGVISLQHGSKRSCLPAITYVEKNKYCMPRDRKCDAICTSRHHGTVGRVNRLDPWKRGFRHGVTLDLWSETTLALAWCITWFCDPKER